MSKIKIQLPPEVEKHFTLDESVEGPIINVTGVPGEIDLRTITLHQAKIYQDLGLSKVLKSKKNKQDNLIDETDQTKA